MFLCPSNRVRGQYYDSYSADIAQADYDYKQTSKGAPIKLGKDYALPLCYCRFSIKDWKTIRPKTMPLGSVVPVSLMVSLHGIGLPSPGTETQA